MEQERQLPGTIGDDFAGPPAVPFGFEHGDDWAFDEACVAQWALDGPSEECAGEAWVAVATSARSSGMREARARCPASDGDGVGGTRRACARERVFLLPATASGDLALWEVGGEGRQPERIRDPPGRRSGGCGGAAHPKLHVVLW